MSSQPQKDYRLPKDLKPVHYDLTIKTDLENLIFKGSVKISLNVEKDTNTIVFNANNLKFASTTLTSNAFDGPLSTDGPIEHDAELLRVLIRTHSTLPKGSTAQLEIGFEGPLTGDMQGYYRSEYEHEGEKRVYALTQFEAIDARRAYPCWDEPALKATFAITMISRSDTVNLSNMPALEEEILTSNSASKVPASLVSPEELAGAGWKLTKFETTPLMSSYLVGYANGKFSHLETTTRLPLSGRDIPLRIYATPDLIHQAQFALDVKAKVLPLYEQAFGIAYPLPKLDTLVAHDFNAGAMENWGLITGRTSAFLIDPERSGLTAKQSSASTQSHEVAHMWFGNITSIEWWTYLYLKEGFATLMGAVMITAVDRIFPEWRLESSFISSRMSAALELDAKLSSHPIEVDCSDVKHIDQIFDHLSYSKAASVLRMLSHYVGEENFFKGVSLYLKKHEYGNSITKDLWEGISQATGLDVASVMNGWIVEMGYPVITVTENEKGIHVRQDRFLENGSPKPEDNKTIWQVPLGIISTDASGTRHTDITALLKAREGDFELDTSKPFKINAGTAGVYRVLYTPERLRKIGKEAVQSHSPFSLNDRMGLVSDAFALAKSGLAQLSSTLTLVETFRDETEYFVWSIISNGLSDLISTWWENGNVIDEINALRRSLFTPIALRLGYEYAADEPTNTTHLRTLAITAAAEATSEDVVRELKRRFSEYIRNGDVSIIPADLLRVTYAIAVKHGGKEEYDAVIKIYDRPKTPTEKNCAISALTSINDQELWRSTFDFVLNKSRDQDVIYFFRGFKLNNAARRIVIEFFEKNYAVFAKRFEGNNTLPNIVELVYSGLSSEADHAKTVDFFKDKDTSKYTYALAQSLDAILARSAYIKRSTADLLGWLKKRKESA